MNTTKLTTKSCQCIQGKWWKLKFITKRTTISLLILTDKLAAWWVAGRPNVELSLQDWLAQLKLPSPFYTAKNKEMLKLLLSPILWDGLMSAEQYTVLGFIRLAFSAPESSFSEHKVPGTQSCFTNLNKISRSVLRTWQEKDHKEKYKEYSYKEIIELTCSRSKLKTAFCK